MEHSIQSIEITCELYWIERTRDMAVVKRKVATQPVARDCGSTKGPLPHGNSSDVRCTICVQLMLPDSEAFALR
jgi:hypothetical protein